MSSAQYPFYWPFLAFLEFLKRSEVGRIIATLFSVLLLGGLTICLVLLVFINTSVKQDIQNLTISQNPFPLFHVADYPIVSDSNSEQKYLFPTVSADAAIIMEKDSHVVLFQKNADLRFSPASTTKIMTALTALDYFKLTDVLTAKQLIDTQGSGINVTLGEQMTFGNLLKAALIYSANDAAVTIAENYPGGVSQFVSTMNKKAQSLRLLDTHFGDPAGLVDSEDYTTATDLIRLAATAMQNPIFANIVGTKSITITSADGQHTYSFANRNILLGTNGVTGIKTGYTDEAGEVLATAAVNNGHSYYIVVMKSQDRFADTKKLLSVLSDVNYISFDSKK